jgi:MFS family permease
MEKRTLISRNVWILSLVSLFTDIASEMLYPVMPVYLKSIGFSIILIGILEGLAEGIAGLSKGFFGNKSDNTGKRLPFVKIGYALSAISKPMMAMFTYPLWVFFAKTLERLGKGIRTAARDALLSDEATRKTKGRVFGFHRSMDTVGAVIGPVLALLYLCKKPGNYQTLFYAAFIPGIAAILFTFFIREKKHKPVTSQRRTGFLAFLHYWKESPKQYRQLVIALLIFALFNSSDVFLLLKIKGTGYNDSWVIGAYIFYNIIYAVFSYPMGMLADRLGMKTIFITGLFLFAAAYSGIACASSLWFFFALFFLYGIYAASTEGIAKAWLTNMSQKEKTATAIGTFTAFQSIATLLASSTAGILWYSYGASYVFAFSAVVAFSVAMYILFSIHSSSDINGEAQ